MNITRIVTNENDYKVMENYNLHGKEEDLQEGSNTLDVGETKTNLLNPIKKSCTCGKWQEFKYPCRHAIGYYRLYL